MAKDDYIKQEDAVCAVFERIRQIGMEGNPYVLSIRQAVRDVPAADVAPVVRCRECKYKPTAPDGITHGSRLEFPDEKHNPCPCQCYDDDWYSWMPDDDFFCERGAKMDEEEEDA